MARELNELGVQPALLRLKHAAAYLGVRERYMYDAKIPRVDMRLPGGTKPVWRYHRDDLDALIAARKVQAGHNVLRAETEAT